MGHKIKYIQQTGSYQKDDHNLKKSTERKSKIGRTISPAAGYSELCYYNRPISPGDFLRFFRAL